MCHDEEQWAPRETARFRKRGFSGKCRTRKRGHGGSQSRSGGSGRSVPGPGTSGPRMARQTHLDASWYHPVVEHFIRHSVSTTFGAGNAPHPGADRMGIQSFQTARFGGCIGCRCRCSCRHFAGCVCPATEGACNASQGAGKGWRGRCVVRFAVSVPTSPRRLPLWRPGRGGP